MIKGLYFKLNMDKRPDKDIYEFFESESKRIGKSKVYLLLLMMNLYTRDKEVHDALIKANIIRVKEGNKNDKICMDNNSFSNLFKSNN